MAPTHVAYLDLAIDFFSGKDPDQDAESLIQLIKRKINLVFEDAPGDAAVFGKLRYQEESAILFLAPMSNR